ncbi:TPA: tyrosine-type recombinase/integrase, partial [Enterococcus faecium]|nr:tyrosine-type recombinase/integrase [Enterococcus faecium]
DGKSDIRLLPGLKNDDDEKIVTGPAYLFDMLDELIKENKKIRWKLNIKKLRHYFIFDTKQDGTLPRGSYLYKKFKRFTKRHNLRHIRFHDIRHTSATYLLSDPNMTPKELQKRLGHRDFNTTMNVYGHVLRKEKDTATTAFENLLKKDIK